jgi:hypothetical protein
MLEKRWYLRGSRRVSKQDAKRGKRLTLAAADAEIWGGWWVGVGAWGKGRSQVAHSRAAELKPLGPPPSTRGRGFAQCLVHGLRGGLPVSAWVRRPSGVGYRSGEESLVVGERQRLRRQAMGRCREGGAWEMGVRGGVLAAEVVGRGARWARLALHGSRRRA